VFDKPHDARFFPRKGLFIMKKNSVIAIVVVVCMAMAAPAFAGPTLKGPTATTTAVSTTIGSAVYVPSTNVQVNACSTPNNYAINSMHNLSLRATGGRAFQALTASGILFVDVSGSSAVMPTCSGGGSGTTTASPPPTLSATGIPL
jgi:hypothetical protein